MNNGLKITTGSLKGKTVPIPPPVKGNFHFTPALVKKSVFSRIDSFSLKGDLEPETSIFVDVFAGSGQMGWEALSLGFGTVVFLELDRSRFSGLIELGKKWKGNKIFQNKDGFRFHSSWEIPENTRSLVYFLDPPYSFWKNQTDKILKMIQEIRETDTGENRFLFIQSPSSCKLDGIPFVEFGNSLLYHWEKID